MGRIVAQGLKREATDRVNIIEKDCDGAALMVCWEGADMVILIDAVHSGALPGTIYRLDAQAQPIPATYFHYSLARLWRSRGGRTLTHAQSVAAAFYYLRHQGKCFEPGGGLTEEVTKAAQDVLEQIQKGYCTVIVAQGFSLDGF